MFKKVLTFYAFAFFLSLTSLFLILSLSIKNQLLNNLVFLSLLCLMFFFPLSVITLFLSKKLKPKKLKSLASKVNFSVGQMLVIIAAAIGSTLLLVLFFARLVFHSDSIWRILDKIKPLPIPNQLTGNVSPDNQLEGIENPLFEKTKINLEENLLFLKPEGNYNYTLGTFDGNIFSLGRLNYQSDLNNWWLEGLEFNQALFTKMGQQYDYYPQTNVFIVRQLGSKGYSTECVPIADEKKLCFTHRFIYFRQFKDRDFPWDGRFYYLNTAGEEEILKFNYSDLKIVWDDPENNCNEDCFSTRLVGYFDNTSKALLSLISETTSNWYGDDNSGWMGFYIVDFKNKSLKPFKNPDFGFGQKSQFDPYLVFSDLDLFVYFRNNKEIIAQNLVTGKINVLRTYQKDSKQITSPVFKNSLDQYLTMSFLKNDEYFDLAQMKQITSDQLPIYVKNQYGFWNSKKTQFAWESMGKYYIYDRKLDKTETLTSPNPSNFNDNFSLVGWGK